MNFIDNLSVSMNKTQTENGAETYISTTSNLLDFFALGGGTRKNLSLTEDLFRKALAEDREKAIRILFYLRDVRGGQGERDVFRTCATILANEYQEEFEKVSNLISEYGRYDDLVYLINTKSSEVVLKVIKEQLIKDMQSETPSLLAKWLPSENTSSKKTRELAKKVRLGLKIGATEREYRKTLSNLRAKIKLVEHNLTNKDYKTIEYSKLPSQATLKYTKAFKRNDEAKYTKYLEDVKLGKEKINTKTLYTYQVYNAVQKHDADIKALDIMWNNLPDYTQGKNAIVVADVSGSMSGEPMSVSVSLALYFAERNKGAFNGYFITFSDNPKLQKIQGSNIREKMYNLERADWGGSTDLQKVFEVLLDTAIANKVEASELPETIYIISDMEFNSCVRGGTNYDNIKARYDKSGYRLPNIVFWNVSARNKQVPVTKEQSGVTLVSGLSTSTFKLVVENKTPMQLMEEVIHSDRYANIKI